MQNQKKKKVLEKKGIKCILPIFLLVVLSTSGYAYWFEPETPPGATIPQMDGRYCLINGTPCVNYTLIANATNGSQLIFNNVTAKNISSEGASNFVGISDGSGNFLRMEFLPWVGSQIAMLRGFSLAGVAPASAFGMYDGLYLIADQVADPAITFYDSAISQNGRIFFDSSVDDLWIDRVTDLFFNPTGITIVGSSSTGWNYVSASGDLGVLDDLEVRDNSYFRDDMSLENNDINNVGTINADYGNFSQNGSVAGNLSVGNNLYVDGYIYGQPIDGGIGSGIIWAEEVTSSGLINVSLAKCFGAERNCSYPSFLARVHLKNNSVVYCNITGQDFIAPDDQDSIYTLGEDCTISAVSMSTIAVTPQVGGRVALWRVMAHDGKIEVATGLETKAVEVASLRFETLLTQNLKIISGGFIEFGLEDFPNYTMEGGRYIYSNGPFDFNEQNISAGAEVELIGHRGGVWSDWEPEGMGINLTHCDDGTDVIDRPDNKPYPTLLFFTGFEQNGDETTELHQLAPLCIDSYPNEALCEEAVISGTVSFVLPSFYDYSGVKTYVYCGRRDDTDWTGAWVDIRENPGGVIGGGTPDLSPYVTRAGDRTMTGDWNTGSYDIRVGGNLSSVENLGTDANLTVGQDAIIEGNVTIGSSIDGNYGLHIDKLNSTHWNIWGNSPP